ncbi:MAG: hypothetical protein IPJ82_13160 [Lewinellaceae bacterium]|nr:hypothetical protein [Lewinellaceae bacterium]
MRQIIQKPSNQMYKINGKVLVKETGAGIPNLQVVVYDLDVISPNTPQGEQELFSAAHPPAEYFWQTLPGNRLGSVLTDLNGQFELTFEDKDFLQNEQIQRPDLILFVLAPEDTYQQDFNGMPVPQSPPARVLHYSYDPVTNAGIQESYIIRLYEELLVRFQIPVPVVASVAPAGPPTVESATTALNRSFEMEQGVKAVLQQQTVERMKPVLAAKRKAEEAFQNFTLSKASPEVRASDTYLNPGENVVPKLERHFDNSLATLPTEDAGADRRLVLHLPEEQINAWGLRLAATAV